ncbi:MAG: hypothetical protein ACR2MN_13910 [Acidimicrobiales bacterium]
MPQFADVTPYRYVSADGALNVGWLGPAGDVPIGPVPDEVMEPIPPPGFVEAVINGEVVGPPPRPAPSPRGLRRWLSPRIGSRRRPR